MLDLFSNNQLISLLEIDQLHNFQVRVGYCYRKAVRFVGSSRIENSPYHALFVKYFNFEIIFDGRQSYFTNFETSDNIPYLIFLSDKNVKYTRDQLYLVNLRLVFPRTERGKILNNIMHTKNCIWINSLDNMVCIKTLKVSPWDPFWFFKRIREGEDIINTVWTLLLNFDLYLILTRTLYKLRESIPVC